MLIDIRPSVVATPPVREIVGALLREERLAQKRSLRSVASQARVSLGYLSEVERGHKEASSELLAAMCGALGFAQSELFARVSAELASYETREARPKAA